MSSQYNVITSTDGVSGHVLTGQLVITKSFSDTRIQVGTTGYFTLVVRNAGPGNIYDIIVTDQVNTVFTNV